MGCHLRGPAEESKRHARKDFRRALDNMGASFYIHKRSTPRDDVTVLVMPTIQSLGITQGSSHQDDALNAVLLRKSRRNRNNELVSGKHETPCGDLRTTCSVSYIL